MNIPKPLFTLVLNFLLHIRQRLLQIFNFVLMQLRQIIDLLLQSLASKSILLNGHRQILNLLLNALQAFDLLLEHLDLLPPLLKLVEQRFEIIRGGVLPRGAVMSRLTRAGRQALAGHGTARGSFVGCEFHGAGGGGWMGGGEGAIPREGSTSVVGFLLLLRAGVAVSGDRIDVVGAAEFVFKAVSEFSGF